jgi:hypothetical protein
LLICGVAEARTWWVLKDGTGDFTVIQDAVDAAASGDTIRIGPGRFDERRIVSVPGWTELVCILVPQTELTLIGSGDQTIVGPEEPWDSTQGVPRGLVAGAYWGNQRIMVEGICFENNGLGIYEVGADAVIRNCVFRYNWQSVGLGDQSASKSLLIEDCRFEYVAHDGWHVALFYFPEIVMRRCMLVLRPYIVGERTQRHVTLMGVANGLVEQCLFFGGSVGFHAAEGGRSTVRECTFDGQYILGASVGVGASGAIERCTFRNQKLISDLYDSYVTLEMYDTVIENVSDRSFYISSAGSVTVNNCDIAKGERGAVYIRGRTDPIPPTVLDMTNNYWGTDDPDSIAAWIHDWHDDPTAPFIVQYEPYRVHSTPVRQESLGGIRNLFRGKRK